MLLGEWINRQNARQDKHQDEGNKVRSVSWLEKGEQLALKSERLLLLCTGFLVTASCCLLLLSVTASYPQLEARGAFLWGLTLTLMFALITIIAWKNRCFLIVIGYWCLITTGLVTFHHLFVMPKVNFPFFSVLIIFLIAIATLQHFVGGLRKPSSRLNILNKPTRALVQATTWPLIILICFSILLIQTRRFMGSIKNEPYVTKTKLSNDGKILLGELSKPEVIDDIEYLFLAFSETVLNRAYLKAFVEKPSKSPLEDSSVFLNETLFKPPEKLIPYLGSRAHISENLARDQKGKAPLFPPFEEMPKGYQHYIHTPLNEDSFSTKGLYLEYINNKEKWQKKAALDLEYHAAWKWFTSNRFVLRNRSLQRQFLITRSHYIHPVNREKQLPINNFMVIERFNEYSSVRQGLALGKLPLKIEKYQEFRIYNPQTNQVEDWNWGVPSSSIFPIVESYPPSENSLLNKVVRSQLKNGKDKEMAMAYWEYLEYAMASASLESEHREIAISLLGLEREDQEVLMNVIIKPEIAKQELTVKGIAISETNPLLNYLGAINLTDSKAEAELASLQSMEEEEFKSKIMNETSGPANNMFFIGLQSILTSEEHRNLLKNITKRQFQTFLNINILNLCSKLKASQEKDLHSYYLLLQLLDNPVYFSWLNLLQNGTPRGIAHSEKLKKFRLLTDNDQEAIINELALNCFYSSPEDPDVLTFIFARLYDSEPFIAWVVTVLSALMFFLPYIWFETWLSRLISYRDRSLTLASIAIGAADDKLRHTTAPTVSIPLTGHQDILRWLQGIAHRGFGTIGIVGRRGVGKTRVLRAILEQSVKNPNTSSVNSSDLSLGVWMSVPTTYQEKEFVANLHYALASSVEASFAQQLQVLPLQARKILNSLKISISLALVFFFLVFLVCWLEVSSALANQSVAFTWPWLLIAATALLFIRSLSGVPPVNLHSWLLREAGIEDTLTGVNAATLYQNVLGFIRKGVDSKKLPLFLFWMPLICASVFLFNSFFYILSIKNITAASNSELMIFCVLFLFLGVGVYSFITKAKVFSSERKGKVRDIPLSKAISEYRILADQVVSVLRSRGTGSVVICLDELDKVVNPEEVKTFIRRMKALFEIEGVFYFVSMAENMYTALIKGRTFGKDEVDSSFDHIIKMKPLLYEECKKLAQAYWDKLTFERDNESKVSLDEPILSFALVFSGGIPRDVFRVLDRWLTTYDISIDDQACPLAFIKDTVKEELNAAVSSGFIEPLSHDDQNLKNINNLYEDIILSLSAARASRKLTDPKSPEFSESVRILIRLAALSCFGYICNYDSKKSKMVSPLSEPDIKDLMFVCYQTPVTKAKHLPTLIDFIKKY